MTKKISHFVNTSDDDCNVSLRFTTVDDLPVLRDALEYCRVNYGLRTKAQFIARRIKKLQKEASCPTTLT